MTLRTKLLGLLSILAVDPGASDLAVARDLQGSGYGAVQPVQLMDRSSSGFNSRERCGTTWAAYTIASKPRANSSAYFTSRILSGERCATKAPRFAFGMV